MAHAEARASHVNPIEKTDTERRGLRINENERIFKGNEEIAGPLLNTMSSKKCYVT